MGSIAGAWRPESPTAKRISWALRYCKAVGCRAGACATFHRGRCRRGHRANLTFYVIHRPCLPLNIESPISAFSVCFYCIKFRTKVQSPALYFDFIVWIYENVLGFSTNSLANPKNIFKKLTILPAQWYDCPISHSVPVARASTTTKFPRGRKTAVPTAKVGNSGGGPDWQRGRSQKKRVKRLCFGRRIWRRCPEGNSWRYNWSV